MTVEYGPKWPWKRDRKAENGCFLSPTIKLLQSLSDGCCPPFCIAKQQNEFNLCSSPLPSSLSNLVINEGGTWDAEWTQFQLPEGLSAFFSLRLVTLIKRAMPSWWSAALALALKKNHWDKMQWWHVRKQAFVRKIHEHIMAENVGAIGSFDVSEDTDRWCVEMLCKGLNIHTSMRRLCHD